jgi:multiple sugar transport system substrate-binding protein
MRRLRGVAIPVVAIALVAGACTGDSGRDSDGGAGGSQEQVTLDMWGFFGEREPYLDALIEAFQAEHPNITINRTSYPEGEYDTKIETAIAAGDPPDLGYVGNIRWLREGLVLPLDNLVQEQGIDLSTYNPSIVGDAEHVNHEFGCSYEGKLYCLGSYLGAVGVFYNKDLFDAAGVPYPAAWPPMTIEEFVDVGCQLTDEASGVYGMAYGYPMEVLPWETVFSTDGRTADATSSTAVAAYDAMAQGIRNGCAPSLNTMDPWEEGADFFSDGQLAMVNTDLQSFKQIEDAGINYGVTAPPTVPGVEPFVQTWTDAIGVFNGSDHPEEAMEFIAFNTTEGQRLRVEVTGDMPVSSAAAEELDWAAGIPGREDALEVVANARPAVFIPNRWDTIGALYDAFGLMAGGDATAQEALSEAQPAVQQELDRAWELWDQG